MTVLVIHLPEKINFVSSFSIPTMVHGQLEVIHLIALIEQRFPFSEDGMVDRGIGISFALKDCPSMFLLWVFGLLALPMKDNTAAATQYKKQKLSRLFRTFKLERFRGLRIGGVAIYEPPGYCFDFQSCQCSHHPS